MKKNLILGVTLLILLISFPVTAATITDGDRILGLYGVQWENGVDESTRFQDAIDGVLPEIILENDYLDGTLGSTGFVMVANWYENERFLSIGGDYQGNTSYFNQNAVLPITDTFEDWNIWWIGYTFTGGTLVDDISRMFATIDYGTYNISEEITREFSQSAPVPEPSTIILFASGLLGLAGIGRKNY